MLIYCKLTKKEISVQQKARTMIYKYGKDDALKFAEQCYFLSDWYPRDVRLAWKEIVELIRNGRP